MTIQPIRGTKDIYPQDYKKYRKVTDIAEKISALYGFEGIITPVIEPVEVFKRTLGEESDVVGKEMYVFEDRGGSSICLRPEFTAGVCRSFINSGMMQSLPLKFYTTGPLFRYERPQLGRQRQFHQINFEVIGSADYISDIELIAMSAHIIRALGLEKFVTLEINSLGDLESRINYRTSLVKYFTSFAGQLSEDSKVRLQKNPLRILDSKDDNDRKIIENAPKLEDYYTEKAKDFFANVKQGLDSLAIKYKVNTKLVRGLDYYNHTVFEFTTDALGSQNTVLAGGRYDGLIKLMGGNDTPAVGCAGGVERLVALLEQIEQDYFFQQPIILMPMGEKASILALKIVNELRQENITAELLLNGNIKKRMKRADQKSASYVIVIGDDEIVNNKVKLKDMSSGAEKEVAVDNITQELKNYKKSV